MLLKLFMGIQRYLTQSDSVGWLTSMCSSQAILSFFVIFIIWLKNNFFITHIIDGALILIVIFPLIVFFSFQLAFVSSRTWRNMVRNRHALMTQVGEML